MRLETKVKYGVIQSGTKLEINSNIGNFDKKKSIEFIEICKKFNIKSKEHNGDYLSIKEIKKRFELGLSAINIAPEFGYIETKCILEEIESLLIKFFTISFLRYVMNQIIGLNGFPKIR